MPNWNYARLSRLAKAYGGPERLVNLLLDAGVKKGVVRGRLQMLPAVLLGIGIGVGIKWLWDKHKAKDKELEIVKQQLIDGINEYDSMHAAGGCADEV